ncbi:MAG: hypothetical protein K0R69_3446 [Clostridia bacterium]|jgi:hypothetical protein|nr:hypothetical protein [Clostridia bacterium]
MFIFLIYYVTAPMSIYFDKKTLSLLVACPLGYKLNHWHPFQHTDVALTSGIFLLCCSGVAFSSFTHPNTLTEDVKQLVGQLRYFSVLFGFFNKTKYFAFFQVYSLGCPKTTPPPLYFKYLYEVRRASKGILRLSRHTHGLSPSQAERRPHLPS